MVGFTYDGNAGKLKGNMVAAGNAVKEACENACKDAAKAIEERGRASIAGGGRFGPRWTQAFNSKTEESGNEIKIVSTMSGGPPVSYWKVFEFGATISGKNGMLAIPIDPNNTVWPRDRGNLFRRGRALFDTQTKEPEYILTPQVTIPQKWHLRDIIKQVANELKGFYHINLR
jgi:hypothetical protein